MSNQEEFRGLGDPLSVSPTRRKKATPQEGPGPTVPEGARAGETGLGIPDPVPEKVEAVSLERVEEIMSRQEAAESYLPPPVAITETAHIGVSFLAPASRVLPWLMLFVSGFFGLFIVNQGVQLASRVSELSQPWQILAIGAATIFVGMLVAVVGRIGYFLLSLRRSQQIDIGALATLAERERLRSLSSKRGSNQLKQAHQQLKLYLDEYCVPERLHARLAAIGVDRKDIDKLMSASRGLRDVTRPLTPMQWLDEYQLSFQKEVDRIGAAVVKGWAKRVALGTASSPSGFIDQMIVLYASYAMIDNLLALYNVRPAFGQTAIVLSRALIQTYLGGMIGDASDQAGEQLVQGWEDYAGEAAGLVGNAAKTVFSKTAEAGLNYMLLWKLGRRAMHIMSPIQTK